ncbi:DUF4349 domain-containing protein [Microbacterium sp. 179-I 3D2 NHS]|uniref:DUF4349 domain-containing protein n=1 Tax=Microbacterium sp. 179-I 3D2 NHS TaxID=3235178 RepID=UPI0039A15D2C
MNDQDTGRGLPELSQQTIDRIEDSVFAAISDERPGARSVATRARTRRRRWLTGVGIAAAFALGVLVTPPILTAVDGSSMTAADGGGSAVDSSALAPDRSVVQLPDGSSQEIADAPALVGGDAGAADREVVATARASVQVTSITDAAAAVSALAEERGGYVESTEIGAVPVVDATSEPVPSTAGTGWVSIRVPSAELAEVIDELDDTGDVISSSISRQDVTATAIDLRARVDATRASVTRLTELMAQSASVSELIEAEVALTDRQAQLESWEQQLAALEDQIEMSTLQVELTRAAAPTSADPAGFGDGLLAGWNGLVVSLNALVVAVGFVLPWLAIAALVIAVVWLIRRSRRGRTAPAAATPPQPREPSE